MTLLVASIQPRSIQHLQEHAKQAWERGADAVEIRLDGFGGPLQTIAEYLRREHDRTWILTCRSSKEGGLVDGKLEDRIATLEAAAGGTGAILDVEYGDWSAAPDLRDRSAGPRAACASASTSLAGRCAGEPRQRLILSAHDFSTTGLTADDTPTGERTVDLLMKEVRSSVGQMVGKVAYSAAHINDSFMALDRMRAYGDSIVSIAMGEDGLWSRVLARKLGGFATYCSVQDESATAPGQVSLERMKQSYQWDRIDAETEVYGVIGDPVAHSMSPYIFDRWFHDAKINAVYLPLRVCGSERELRVFLNACRARPWLDLCGFSVTTPHKSSALQCVGDGADWAAKRIGALNTLCLAPDGISAFNTDCHAVVESLTQALGGDRRTLCHLPVDVLGTGGAARAVVYGLPMSGCQVTLYGRSTDRVAAMAKRFDVQPARWEDRVHGKGRVLVNCTTVGMAPAVDDSPMPADALDRYDLVFDLIYNPLQTRLLRDAANAGAATLNGVDMFVRQATMQFELWTGQTPDAKVADRVIHAALSTTSEASS